MAALPDGLSPEGLHTLRQACAECRISNSTFDDRWLRQIVAEAYDPVMLYSSDYSNGGKCLALLVRLQQMPWPLGEEDLCLVVDYVWPLLYRAWEVDAAFRRLLSDFAFTSPTDMLLQKMTLAGALPANRGIPWRAIKSLQCFALLEDRLDASQIDAVDKDGATALFFARNEEVFRLLVSKGADCKLLWEARTLPQARILRMAIAQCASFALDPKAMLCRDVHPLAQRTEYVELLHDKAVEIPRRLIDSCTDVHTCHALLSFGYRQSIPMRINLSLLRWHPRTHHLYRSPLLRERIALCLLVFKRFAPQLPRDLRYRLLELAMN